MATQPILSPPGIIITGNNWFHDGWLFGILGLPKRTFDSPDAPVRDIDIDAWEDGYQMAVETRAPMTNVFRSMQEAGQLIISMK